jgi:methylmalonyl-CoA/ethylmalonyl-CoA epimerase
MNATNFLDHVAIAVRDLDSAISYYCDVLGFPAPELETVTDQRVRTAIFGSGLGRIELICPTDGESAVARFLDKRGEGLHHICVEVDELDETLKVLKGKGVPLIDETPRIGAGGARIAFVHPKGGLGVLTELRERDSTRG